MPRMQKGDESKNKNKGVYTHGKNGSAWVSDNQFELNVGFQFLVCRRQKALLQADLCVRMGMDIENDRSQISKIEHGHRHKLFTLKRYADALGVPLWEFIRRAEEADRLVCAECKGYGYTKKKTEFIRKHGKHPSNFVYVHHRCEKCEGTGTVPVLS